MSSKKEQAKRKRNGEGTIYQLKSNGKWIAQIPINGKRTTVATGFDFDKVNAEYERIKVELRNNSYIEKDGKTVGAILEQNLRNQEHSNKIEVSTMLRNRQTAKVILKAPLSQMPIQKVQRQDIQDFLNEIAQTVSNSYIDKIHIQLSKVFRVAKSDKLISKDYFADGDIEKPESAIPDKTVDALTREEHKKFLEQLEKKDYKYKDIFYVLIETGMRVRRGVSITEGQHRF